MIQHELALTANGKTTPISKAVRNIKYYCRGCGGEMIPKMGAVNRHHFAHVSDCTNPNYQPETEQHYNTKIEIAAATHSFHEDMIQYYLNKTVKVQNVQVEKSINGFIADVLVETDGGSFAFEVVNTHYADDQKRIGLRGFMIEHRYDYWKQLMQTGDIKAMLIKKKWNSLLAELCNSDYDSLESDKLKTLYTMIGNNDFPMFYRLNKMITNLEIRDSDTFKSELKAAITAADKQLVDAANELEEARERAFQIKNYQRLDHTVDIAEVADWI
ncbi:competence protein CoiA family protein [Aeromonas hydrophila]|uniref:competence protein CoiA family protein n=1 Tax=Aeromonas hydrophila TaxID=644 RepID=UPI000AACDB63|nr:competence protein CoiA family protein [Aeromonas hydrophila]EGX6957491.1 hypothetical protein [Aeromonas hydrophila]MCA4697954.1 hypothetical protein [Aeromonas hydrophila]MCO4221059.1 hypothetical protein [Aeromonas hydrophila]QIO18412.1 hypothetical protein G9455_11405 [Aeromonas hydrophila]USJ78829.1 hypothetical protein LDP97_07235 [Aeromonas hydrophila]